MCVCMFVTLWICSICMHLLMCRCEPVDAHVKTRRCCLVYMSVTPILLFEIGPLSEPDAHQPANLLASQQALACCLHLPPQCWDYWYALPLLAFHLGAGDSEVRSS